jgi:BCD family chlorophyll transporter-like MFS transporter
MVGIVVGAIVSSRLLDTPNICGTNILTYDPTQSAPIANIPQLQANVNPVFAIMPAIVFLLCILATFGVEKNILVLVPVPLLCKERIKLPSRMRYRFSPLVGKPVYFSPFC